MLLAALSLLAQSDGPQAPQRGRELVTYYCSGFVQPSGPRSQSVSVTKVFLEDGSVYRQEVELSGPVDFIRAHRAGDRFSVALKWPAGDRYVPGARPFSWEDGSIQIISLPQGGIGPEQGEFWQRTVIDRRGGVSVMEHGGIRMLMTTRMGSLLTTGFEPPPNGGTTLLLGNLLAWGHGVARLTGYLLLVRRRPYGADVPPGNGIGRERIVSQYEIEVAGLTRQIAKIREAVTTWERSISDFQACRREIEYPEQEVLVINGSITAPRR
jgi:hypothetical protein